MSTRIQILKDGVIKVASTANDRQSALNSLVSTMTANRVLRSNGSNLVLAQVDLSTDVTGVLSPANGGFGSSANFVDLTTAQTIGGLKTFSEGLILPATPHTTVGTIWRNGANLEFRNSANTTQVLLNSAGNLSNLSDKQIALNNLVGAVTSGNYLRANGTNIVLSTIQASDVPTLNQNTTGTASNITGITAIFNGGTGSNTKNFVDLTTSQLNIAGQKVFSSVLKVNTGNGSIGLMPGSGVSSGYLEIHKSDGTTRLGYIGFDNVNLNYTSENGALHTFSGGGVRITNTTQSTSTTTGAHIVTGGQAVQGNQYTGGFTSLGDNIAIKMKRLTGTTAATQNGNSQITHGIPIAKIIGFKASVNYNGAGYMLPNITQFAGYQYDAYIDNAVVVIFNSATNSANILSKPVSVIIYYIE